MWSSVSDETVADLLRNFARCLKRSRQDMDLSQGAIARMAGVSRKMVCDIEAGHGDPRLSTLVKLAKPVNRSAPKMLVWTPPADEGVG